MNLIVGIVLGVGTLGIGIVVCALLSYLLRVSRAGNAYLARERVITAERNIFFAMQRGDTAGVALAQKEYNAAVETARELGVLE